MTPAAKSPVFEAWFGRHVEGRLRGAFTALRARGLEGVRRAAAQGPLVWFGNHTSWWDPLVIFHLSRTLSLDGHAMMDAKNLADLPFFAKIGAFGVDLDDPADGARALRYAARLLSAPRRMVAVFPQGRERPVTERPLGFRPGAAELARLAPRAAALPFALRYEMAGEEKPFLYVSFGDPVPASRVAAETRAAHEASVTALLDRIDRDLCAGELDEYVPLFVSRSAIAPLAASALAWLFDAGGHSINPRDPRPRRAKAR